MDFHTSVCMAFDPLDQTEDWSRVKLQASHASKPELAQRIFNNYILRRLWAVERDTLSLRVWLSTDYTPLEWLSNVTLYVVPFIDEETYNG